MQIDGISIEVVPSCYALDPASPSLFSDSGLTTAYSDPAISIDSVNKKIVIDNTAMVSTTKTFYFSIAANDAVGTVDNDPPIEYQVDLIDSCLSNTILPLSTNPYIVYE